MTAQGGDWERLDAVAATPAPIASAGASSPGSARRGRPFRLKRSRGPVLAALDGGGTVFQRRLRDVMIGATVDPRAGGGVERLGDDPRVRPPRPERLRSCPPFLGDDTGSGIEDVAVWLAAVFASFVTAVVGHFAAQILLGDRFRTPVTLPRALARTARRLPSILAAWGLTHWWFPLMALIVVTAQPDVVWRLDLPLHVRVLVLRRRDAARHPGHGGGAPRATRRGEAELAAGATALRRVPRVRAPGDLPGRVARRRHRHPRPAARGDRLHHARRCHTDRPGRDGPARRAGRGSADRVGHRAGVRRGPRRRRGPRPRDRCRRRVRSVRAVQGAA